MRLIIAATAVLSMIGLSQAAANPVCQETHLVAKGETCQTVASNYGHTQSEIQQWTKKSNSAFDCNNLKAGESICVKYASVDKRGEKPKSLPKKKTTTVPPKPHQKKPEHAKRGEAVKKAAAKKKTTTKKAAPKKHTTVKKHTTTKKPVAKKN